MKDDTTYGLSAEQLARLLAIGLEGSKAQKSHATAATPGETLQRMLAAKLPLDPANPDSLPAVLNRSCDEFLSAADRTIGDLLLNAETDLAIIKSLKDYGKELVRRGGPEAKQAATAVYYGAIASALVFHHEKITQHSYQKLHEAYAELGRKPWVSSRLRKLFRKARAVCQQQKHISE